MATSSTKHAAKASGLTQPAKPAAARKASGKPAAAPAKRAVAKTPAKGAAVTASAERRAAPARPPRPAAGSAPRKRATERETGVPDGATRHALIAEAAYLIAARRGFAPGQELDDWLAAELEIDAMFAAGTT